MYRLFSRITRGLEPVSQIFKQVLFVSIEVFSVINLFDILTISFLCSMLLMRAQP
jgi:hypothetical protein